MDNEQLFDWLCRAGQGDQAAFEALYRATSPTLYAVCLHLLGRREWAEEVLQESFVRVWHQAGDYTPTRGNVLTWMTSITRYRAIDALRHSGRRPEAALDEARLATLNDEDPGPLDTALAAGDAGALARCLEELSDDQRRCIRMAFMQGMTHAELVDSLQRSLGTVKSWIRRGLQSLKRCLTE